MPDYLAAEPRRATRHRLLVLADQGASSLSNVLVTVLVARQSSPVTFGYFALTMVAYQFATGAIRSVVGEPLLSLYAQKGPRARRRILSDVHGAAVFLSLLGSTVVLGLAALEDAGPSAALVALAIVLPFVIVQDTWRYLFVIDRPAAALAIDLVWLISVGVGLSLVSADAGADRYVLAWGISGALGAVAGMLLGWSLPTWPHPWKWLVGHKDMCWRYLTEFVTASGVTQIDYAVLALISGAAALGAARAAWVVFGVLVVVHSGLYMVLVPEGARERDQPERLRRKFVVASLGAMGLSAFWMLAGLAVPRSWGIRLFNETWAQADRLIVPMGLAMIAGGALSGGVLGVRSLGDARGSLAARLRSAPFQALCPLIGAVLGDAMGFVLGIAVGNVVATVIWWTRFLQATAPRRRPLAARTQMPDAWPDTSPPEPRPGHTVFGPSEAPAPPGGRPASAPARRRRPPGSAPPAAPRSWPRR